MEVKSFVFKFDDVEVREREFSLIKAGKVLNVEPKAFRALVFLLRNPQKLISKEEILNTVWGDAAVTEGSLTRCIWHLRSVLGDDIRSPRYIETVATVGYRFVCKVEVAEDNAANLEEAGELRNQAERKSGASQSGNPKSGRRAILTSALVASIVVALVLGWAWWSHTMSSQITQTVKSIPLTTYPGVEQEPSLSPDGSQVAFSWNGPDQANFDIYIKTTRSGTTVSDLPLRLTQDAADDINPVWSPDGSSIAFLRKLGIGNRLAVLLIPALGGQERKLAEVSIPQGAWFYSPYISWTPDSHSLVVTDNPSPDRPTALFVLSVRTGEKRQLTFPPNDVAGDHCPAVSPDGNTLAFRRLNVAGNWRGDIYLLGLDNDFNPRGQPRPITLEPRPMTPDQFFRWSCVSWTGDSQRLVFYYDLGLWTLPVSVESRDPVRGQATMAVETGTGVNFTTTSRTSPQLVYALKSGGIESIWRTRIPASHERTELPQRMFASTKGEFSQQYSPNGMKVAFESARGGNLEIWICGGDGQNCAQLTSMGSTATGVPTWSPDGKQVAFYSNLKGSPQIFAIPVEGGPTRQITSQRAGATFPRWSRDGKWIYFSSKESGTTQIWKVPADGGQAVQVTRGGGLLASESPDRKWLYFSGEGADSTLRKMPIGGGEEIPVVPSVTYWNFAVMEDGVYFITSIGHGSAIEFLNFSTGKTEVVAPIQAGYLGFSISPDRKWILYCQDLSLSSELVLGEGFR